MSHVFILSTHHKILRRSSRKRFILYDALKTFWNNERERKKLKRLTNWQKMQYLLFSTAQKQTAATADEWDEMN